MLNAAYQANGREGNEVFTDHGAVQPCGFGDVVGGQWRIGAPPAVGFPRDDADDFPARSREYRVQVVSDQRRSRLSPFLMAFTTSLVMSGDPGSFRAANVTHPQGARPIR